MKKIKLVRFKEHMAIGTGLDQKSYLEDGGTVLGVPVKLSKYDEIFLKVQFCGKDPVNKYVQLVPWSAVATVLGED